MKRLFFAIITIGFFLCLSSCDTSESDFEKAIEKNSISAYEMFIAKHPKSSLCKDAKDSIVAMVSRDHSLAQIQSHIELTDYPEVADQLREVLDERVEERYQAAEAIGTIDAWQAFIDNVPVGHTKDAKEKIEEIKEREEQANWASEAKAWATVEERDNIASYRKYMELYPHGRHAKQVERKLIDFEVDAVFAGEHGTLPSMDKGYNTGSSRSTIEIENRTQYELTVSYSGPDSKRMEIPAYGTRKITIGNGYYRVAASVGHGVIPFAGTEQLDGSYFSSSFYIETRRW